MHRNISAGQQRSRGNLVSANKLREPAGLNTRNSALIHHQPAGERLLPKFVIVVIALAGRTVDVLPFVKEFMEQRQQLFGEAHIQETGVDRDFVFESESVAAWTVGAERGCVNSIDLDCRCRNVEFKLDCEPFSP